MRTTYLRLLQLGTGVLVAVLLSIHLVMMHLDAILGFFGVDAIEQTAWGAMIDRASQDIFVGLYIALLAFGIYHALYGLRHIVLEVAPSVRTERIITWVIIAFGIIFFIGGAYVPVALLAG